jgi:site-specific DNA-methyltransferase (cytosine-N4-specific)
MDIPVRCIAAGCPPGGHVLNPFSGSGTTIVAAHHLGHPVTGIDLNPAYHQITGERLAEQPRHRSRRGR